MGQPIPIILLSGMGANEHLFDVIRPSFPSLITPNWPAAVPGETMSDYARRLAGQIDPHQPCIVGGSSFGGMIALELLPYLPQCRQCLLIGSIRGPQQLPWPLRTLIPLGTLLPLPLIRVSQVLMDWTANLPQWMLPFFRREFLKQTAVADPAFLRWAIGALGAWKPCALPEGIRVVQIHGERDLILWRSLTTPDVVIPRASHLLVLSHAGLVAQEMRERLEWG
jgi:pimeloyl-ACP methyl ester carboxylesterase